MSRVDTGVSSKILGCYFLDVSLFTECRGSGGWENLATGGVYTHNWVYTTAGSVISPIL